MASYGEYVAKEYPKRARFFCGFAGTLGMYAKDGSITANSLLKYLGNPDLIHGTMENGTLAYFYDQGSTNRWVVYADLKEGKLARVGFNDATVNDHSSYREYSQP